MFLGSIFGGFALLGFNPVRKGFSPLASEIQTQKQTDPSPRSNLRRPAAAPSSTTATEAALDPAMAEAREGRGSGRRPQRRSPLVSRRAAWALQVRDDAAAKEPLGSLDPSITATRARGDGQHLLPPVVALQLCAHLAVAGVGSTAEAEGPCQLRWGASDQGLPGAAAIGRWRGFLATGSRTTKARGVRSLHAHSTNRFCSRGQKQQQSKR